MLISIVVIFAHTGQPLTSESDSDSEGKLIAETRSRVKIRRIAKTIGSCVVAIMIAGSLACTDPNSNDASELTELSGLANHGFDQKDSSTHGLDERDASSSAPEALTTPGPLRPDSASTTGTPQGQDEAPEFEISKNPGQAKGVVSPGDSLSVILQRVGMNAQEIYRLSQALTPLMDPSQLKLGQVYEIKIQPDGTAESLRIQISPALAVEAKLHTDGSWTAEKDEAQTRTREVTLFASIESSLYQSILDAGEHSSLVNIIADVFAYDINFFVDPRKGDRMRAVVERVELDDGTLLHYGDILVAEYQGDVGTFRIYRWQAPKQKEAIYVNDEGKGVAKTLLKTPLAYTRVSSEFNPKRMHPVLHRVKGHFGVDFAAPEGTPIRAAANGVIRFRGPKRGAGNFIVLAHDGKMTTLYMHLSKFAAGQKVGQKVTQKTVIGYVGMTGLATGPHLHFGVKVAGRYVDPLKVEGRRGVGVKRKHRAKFQALRNRWRSKLDAIAQNPS